MTTRAGSLAVLAVCALTLTGCTFTRARTNIQNFNKRAASVVPGQTKEAELIQLLGSPPNNVITTREGRVLIYTFGDSKTGGLNLLLVNFGKTNVGIDSAIFSVDRNGIVQDSVVSTNSDGLTFDFWPFGE